MTNIFRFFFFANLYQKLKSHIYKRSSDSLWIFLGWSQNVSFLHFSIQMGWGVSSGFSFLKPSVLSPSLGLLSWWKMKFRPSQRSCPSDHRVLSHLSVWGPSCPVTGLGGSKCFQFTMSGSPLCPVNLQSSRNWFKILSWSKPQHNLIADLINMRLYLYQRWTCLFLIKIAKKRKENLFEIKSMTR